MIGSQIAEQVSQMYQKVTGDISDHLKRTVQGEREYNKKILNRNKEDIITDVGIAQDRFSKEIYMNIEIPGVIDSRLSKDQAIQKNQHQFLHQYLQERDMETKFDVKMLKEQNEKLDEKLSRMKRFMEEDIKDAKNAVSKAMETVKEVEESNKETEEFRQDLKVFNVRKKHDNTVGRLEKLELATKKTKDTLAM